MDDIVVLLDRETREVKPSPAAYQDTLKRARSRHHRRRIGVAVLALVIATAGTAFAVTAFHTQSPKPASNLVQVPNITGLMLRDANRVLTALGLRVGAVSPSAAPFAPKGIVVEQRPGPSRAAEGTAVRLTVSNGLPIEHGGRRVLVRSVLVPLTHPGRYEWLSARFPNVRLSTLSLKARVIGAATLAGPYRVSHSVRDKSRLRIRFRITKVSGPAWVAILRIGPSCELARTRALDKQVTELHRVLRDVARIERELRSNPSPKRAAELSARIAALEAERAELQALMKKLGDRCAGPAG